MLIRVATISKGYRDIFNLLYGLQWLHLLFRPKNCNKFLLFRVKIKKINRVTRIQKTRVKTATRVLTRIRENQEE